MAREAQRVATVLVATVLVAVVLAAAGCVTEQPEPSGGGSRPASGGSRLAAADLWLSFEQGTLSPGSTPEFSDAAGRPFVGRAVVADGGAVRLVEGADGDGQAIALPERCAEAVRCPRAMVEVAAHPALDPGDDPFSYGARVWLAPDQATDGSNVVQKGRFGSAGGQWKLQVDGEDGRPSCVVRSGDVVLTVRSTVSVADGSWHDVRCHRDTGGLAVEVDGARDEEAGRTGSVTSDAPIRIGSPGVGPDDDQFHGRIDDVFLAIGATG